MEENEIALFLKEIKSLLSLTLSHLKINSRKKDIRAGFDSLIKMVQESESETDIESIRKDYRSLIINMDTEEKATEKEPKHSFLSKFFKKEKKTDPLKQLLEIAENLLQTFAKGTLLLIYEENRLFKTITQIKSGAYKDYSEKQASKYGQQIISFYMGQSMEKEVITKEKNELKNIISILAGSIQKIGTESETFDSKLGIYASKIEAASSIDDIIKAKKQILYETEMIREVNRNIDAQFKKAQEKISYSASRINELEQELEKIKRELTTDPITGVYNREALDIRVETAIKQVQEGRKLACLIVVDLDDFEVFNDAYSRHAGDQVLKTVAMLSNEIFDDRSFITRYGSDEFGIVIFEKHFQYCENKSEELLKAIRTHKFIANNKTIHVTVSIGIAMINQKDTLKTIYQRTDQHLNQAKSAGKDCVKGKET